MYKIMNKDLLCMYYTYTYICILYTLYVYAIHTSTYYIRYMYILCIHMYIV